MKPTSARLHQANSTNSGQPDRSSEGINRLFVYGTLVFEDVISALLDRIPHQLDAKAPGWRIVRLPEKVYPGLIPGHDEATGKVLTDLTDAEWATLDAFEDPDYALATVRVMIPLETDVLTYIWRGEHVDQPWSTVEFGRNDLADYLDRCLRWRR
ncbi:MAG: gamma-glutamylcyclotransferase family protein, partial [Candidatus Dormibacteria bacterium]